MSNYRIANNQSNAVTKPCDANVGILNVGTWKGLDAGMSISENWHGTPQKSGLKNMWIHLTRIYFEPFVAKSAQEVRVLTLIILDPDGQRLNQQDEFATQLAAKSSNGINGIRIRRIRVPHGGHLCLVLGLPTRSSQACGCSSGKWAWREWAWRQRRERRERNPRKRSWSEVERVR